jgi:hypothetical protein
MESTTDTPPSPASPPAPERRDEDGLPLDRAPTIDDVRGGANHFKFAIGCTAVVAVLLLAFWVLRVALAR